MQDSTNREKLAYIYGQIQSENFEGAYDKCLELGFDKNNKMKSDFYYISDPDNRVAEWLILKYMDSFNQYNSEGEISLESNGIRSLTNLIKHFFDYQFGYEFGFGIEERKETIEEDYEKLKGVN